MGLQQSKCKKLYQQVMLGNIQGIRGLHGEGAGFSWRDREGKSALIVACMEPELVNVAETLIELNAPLCVFDHLGNTPLHYAAYRGLDRTVELLLSNGANAFSFNHMSHTPLGVAREEGYIDVVRTIENHICLFSGWLREVHGPGSLEALAPQSSQKIWVVVTPSPYGALSSFKKSSRSEIAIYSSPEDGKPSVIIALSKAKVEEPKFYEPDPVLLLNHMDSDWDGNDYVTKKYMFASANEGDKEQLQRFHDACGVRPQVSWGQRRNMALRAVSGTTASASTQLDDSHICSNSSNTASRGDSTDNPRHKGYFSSSSGESFPIPSAPPIPESADYGPIHYPSANISSINGPRESNAETNKSANIGMRKEEEVDDYSSCKICLVAHVEGACYPCGHMAGCMSCLNEIKAKGWGCPICRAKINQILRIYSS